jgi:phosphomevalonate kinase
VPDFSGTLSASAITVSVHSEFMRASAPGKLLFAGEYAVLDGGDAVVAAVNRRAVARLLPDAPAPTPLLRAVRQTLAAHYGPESPAAQAAAAIAVESSALCARGDKLGLGSSAAACTAAVACAIAAAEPERPLDRAQVMRLARSAHGDAQGARGARGSGVDVAATVLGGVLAARADGAARPLTLPPGLELVAIWTGIPADTVTLVASVRAFATAEPSVYRHLSAQLADAATQLVTACDELSAAGAVEALASAGRALAELGRRADVALELGVHRRLREVAESCGGTAKPTGAGGGDVALAAFPSAEAARHFRKDLVRIGLEELDLSVDPIGIAIG